MFRRRIKQPLSHRLQNLVWPRMGWWRWLRYTGHRIGRLPGTPYSIAAGFASGAAASFTPFLGFHFILGALLGWLVRANIIAALVGTVVGNPWTFPAIWATIYRLGFLVTGQFNPDFEVAALTITTLIDNPYQILWPMAVGGFLAMPVVWLVVFVPCYYLVRRYQAARRRRLRRKQLRQAAYTTNPQSTEPS